MNARLDSVATAAKAALAAVTESIGAHPINMPEAAIEAIEAIEAQPIATGIILTAVPLVAAPMLVAGPALSAIGFGAAGPVAGLFDVRV